MPARIKTIIFLIFLLLFSLPIQSFAEPVQLNDLRKVAKYWIKHNASFAKERQHRPELKYKIKSVQKIVLDSEEFPAYAVELDPFGYLIISADDDLHPILSYSNNSNLDLTLHENNAFRNLLKRDLKASKRVLIDKQTRKIQEHKETSKKKWNKYKLAADNLDLSSSEEPPVAMDMPPESVIVVDELLQTRWNQNNHYNELTPEANDISAYYDGHIPTGCVATAFAQLMKYHNWPWYGKGQHSYSDNSGSITGDHTASFSDLYDWANMQNEYAPYSSEPAAAVEAVSELMYEVGVGSEMDYEEGGSAASYKMYGRLAAQFFYHRGSYVSGSSTDMINTLIAEMSANAPTAVSIPSHAIVADGHSTEGTDHYFHVNYGWAGTNNGWYLLNGLPDGESIEYVYPGNIPRAVPLLDQSTNIGETFTLYWKFPEYYSSAEAIRLREGRLQWQDLLVDTADDFSNWQKGEGDSSLWTIENGQFHWARNDLYHYNSLEFLGPVVPSENTFLEFDLKTILINERLALEASMDNGETWITLDSWTNTGWNNSTDTHSIDLSAYSGSELLIRFYAIYESGSYYTSGGVWIDNISLSNCEAVAFVERSDNITVDLSAQSVDISNLAYGKNFYNLQTLNDGTWSEVSPIISVFNPNQPDADTDGIPDESDNCPLIANPDQNDANSNGVGDACDDSDSDGDGLSDAEEYVLGSDPGVFDRTITWPTPETSSLSMTIFGTAAINTVAVDAGDEISVFDSDGVLCGHEIVDSVGSYGNLLIYGDNPATLDIDEGASPGEALRFKIWDASAQQVMWAESSPATVTWTDADVIPVDLNGLLTTDGWSVNRVDPAQGMIDWLGVEHETLIHSSYLRIRDQYYYIYHSNTPSPLSGGGENYTYATLLDCNQLTGEPAPGPYDTDGPQWADLTGVQGGSIELFDHWQDISDLTIHLDLNEGWNLISVPLNNLWHVGVEPPQIDTQSHQIQEQITSINTLLDSIEGQYDLLRSFDTEGAKTFDPDLPEYLNTLDYLAGGYGYWIKMNQPGTLSLTGQASSSNDTLQLHTGWNLVGHWGGAEKQVALTEGTSTYAANTPIADDLSTIIDSIELIRGLDEEGAKTYDPDIPEELNTLQTLEPGKGYWIKLNQDQIIEFAP